MISIIYILTLMLMVDSAFAGENYVIKKSHGVSSVVDLTEARNELFKIKDGDNVEKLVLHLGYPDEVRIPKGATLIQGEWRRWCYGVEVPQTLPLVGTVVIGTNLNVITVIPAVAKTNYSQSQRVYSKVEGVRCVVTGVMIKTNYMAPELRVWAEIKVVNDSGVEIVVPSEWRSLEHLVSYEVINKNETVVFERRVPMMGKWEPGRNFLTIGKKKTVSAEFAIFQSGVNMGIPAGERFKIRFFLFFNGDKYSVSDYFEFNLESP